MSPFRSPGDKKAPSGRGRQEKTIPCVSVGTCATRPLLRAAKGTLEVFLRVRVVAGHFFGVVTVESAIHMRVVAEAAEFVAVDRRLQVAVDEIALVARFGKGHLQCLVGEIGSGNHDAVGIVVIGIVDMNDVADIFRFASCRHLGRQISLRAPKRAFACRVVPT